MRNIDDKFTAHVVHAFFFLDFQRKLIVGLLQLADRLLQVSGQAVERLAELADLIALAALILGGKIQLAHPVGHAGHRDQRAGELAGDEKAADQADQQRAAARDQQENQVEGGVLLDIGVWHIGEQAVARVAVKRADQAEVLVVIPEGNVQELVIMLGNKFAVHALRD